MNHHADEPLTPLERRLARQRPLPPSLRPRVLAAVEDVLRDRGCRHETGGIFGARIPFAACATIAVALALLLALTLPQPTMNAHFQPAGLRPLPSLADRARAAGIEFDLAPAHVGQLAVDTPMMPTNAHPARVLRSIDSRRLLEGEL